MTAIDSFNPEPTATAGRSTSAPFSFGEGIIQAALEA